MFLKFVWYVRTCPLTFADWRAIHPRPLSRSSSIQQKKKHRRLPWSTADAVFVLEDLRRQLDLTPFPLPLFFFAWYGGHLFHCLLLQLSSCHCLSFHSFFGGWAGFGRGTRWKTISGLWRVSGLLHDVGRHNDLSPHSPVRPQQLLDGSLHVPLWRIFAQVLEQLYKMVSPAVTTTTWHARINTMKDVLWNILNGFMGFYGPAWSIKHVIDS